jgi:hypothetical protein
VCFPDSNQSLSQNAWQVETACGSRAAAACGDTAIADRALARARAVQAVGAPDVKKALRRLGVVEVEVRALIEIRCYYLLLIWADLRVFEPL